MPHHWTVEDDLVVFYVYRFGTDKLTCTIKDLAQLRGITIGSFKMRLANFAAIDGKPGLDHYGKISKKVYDLYNKTDEKTFRRVAFPNLGG